MGTFRSLGASVLLASTVFGAAAEGGGSPDTAVCDRIAAYLRADRELVSGRFQERPFEALSRGPHPFFERAVESDRGNGADDAQKLALEQRFQTKFNPSGDLKKTLHQFFSDDDVVESLAGSAFHVAIDTGGTAHCQTFLFFTAGAQAKQVPNSPLDANRSDGDMRFCYEDSGDLVGIGGVPALVESNDSVTGFDSRLSVTEWRNGGWTSPCSVSTHFLSRYAVKKTYLASDGGVSKESLVAAMPRFAQTFDDAHDPDSLSFESIPSDERAAAEKMKSLADTGEVQVPSFGAPENELEPYYSSIDRTHVYPVRLDGRLYLMRVGHATIGWRDFEDLVVIFYTLKSGALAPVATAIVDKSQGPLVSVSVAAGR